MAHIGALKCHAKVLNQLMIGFAKYHVNKLTRCAKWQRTRAADDGRRSIEPSVCVYFFSLT